MYIKKKVAKSFSRPVEVASFLDWGFSCFRALVSPRAALLADLLGFVIVLDDS